jgi:hypothetical protein
VEKETAFLAGNPTPAEQQACKNDRPVFFYLQIAEPDFQQACQNVSIRTEKPIALNDMLAGNKDNRWLPNTTTLRRASLQPIRKVLTLGENTLHPSVPEAVGSKFIRKYWQIRIRLHGSVYQKTVVFLFAAPTEIKISHDRILQKIFFVRINKDSFG